MGDMGTDAGTDTVAGRLGPLVVEIGGALRSRFSFVTHQRAAACAVMVRENERAALGTLPGCDSAEAIPE